VNPSQVSAVIVTRGNTDLAPVIRSLAQFDDIVVWDNSIGPVDCKTYGRVRALERVKHDVIFSQDDDIIHSPKNQRAILSAYEPGILTGCMWAEWSAGAAAQGIEGGYSDLVFPGSGSVYDRDLPGRACARYLEHYPRDDFFLLWADTIVGILTPNRQLDIRFRVLPEAEADYRMANLPNAVELKTEAIRRAREIRDRKPSGFEVAQAEAVARVQRTFA
jgi:glycosyltransferase involved in cell wall biosynthesis